MTNEEALAKAQEHFGEEAFIGYEETFPHCDNRYNHQFWIWSKHSHILGSSNESWEDAFADAFERQGKRGAK